MTRADQWKLLSVIAATVLSLGLTAGVAIAVGGGPSGADAADHLDAPGLTPPGG